MPTPAQANTFCTPRALWTGAAITAAVNTGIALVLWLSAHGDFGVQMVYSQAIGLSIWALINGGARWLARPQDAGGFPRGWRAAALVPGAIGTGVVVGTLVGDWYAGQSTWALTEHNPVMAGKLLAMSLGVGLAMTLYFYLQGRGNYLAAELERTQRLAAEAQLALLQSQLEPHMLFNTLANLRVLIALDADKAQAMLDHLIAYLRATLSASRHANGMHPLATEFERLADYLALMAIRMGPRLAYTLDLPEALRQVPVPPLLLQPLVENAIRHGLEPQVAGGHITVRASRQGQQLTLEVTDTGVGLHPTHAATPSAEAGASTGFGLTQVRERLATTYGPTSTFEIRADNPTGTSAKATIYLKNGA